MLGREGRGKLGRVGGEGKVGLGWGVWEEREK